MKKVVLFLLVFISASLRAQEKLGITNSNYSSTNSIYLNPSSSVDSKTYMQLNLVGANVFFFNNIGYLPWFSIWRLKRHPGEIQFPKIDNSRFKKFLYANAGVDGPAFVMSKGKFGAGIFVRARSVADLKRVPYQIIGMALGDNPYTNYQSSGSVNLRNVKSSNMTWVEYGVNFGMIVKQEQRDQLAFGGSLRYLTGINIFYGNVTRMKGSYTDSTVNVDEISGRLRYNEPAWNTGRGVGLDIGATYKKMLRPIDNYNPHTKQSNCTTVDYKYKIAASLRDVGYIRFTKGGIKTNWNASGSYNSTTDTTRPQLETDLNLTTTPGNILATLPTNLSVQFDWNFENHIYLNGTVVKNLVPNRLTGVQSPNLISLCPRLEFKQFEVAMPLTFQRFVYPQLGFAFRIRSFVLGYDNKIPLLLMKPRTYGLGVYFNLGISLFKNPACRTRTRSIDDCPPNILGRDKAGNKKRSWKFWKRKKRNGQ
jgi:hypothetical protein